MAYQFSPKTEDKFQWLLTRYPKKDAVLLPLLHQVQNEAGYLSPEAIDYVAGRMGLSSARVREVASFYTLFRLNPKGKYVLQVCHNLSCYLRGAEDIIQKMKDLLGIEENQTTPDGLFTLERAECLASCSTGPCMQVNNWDFHEELTAEKTQQVLNDLRQGKHAKASYAERVKEGSVA